MGKILDREGLAARIEGFVNEVNEIIIENAIKNDYDKECVAAELLNRYVRINKMENGKARSVYCFIDRSNGDILKAASYKAPAKHARGNVFSERFGVAEAGCSAYGVRHL